LTSCIKGRLSGPTIKNSILVLNLHIGRYCYRWCGDVTMVRRNRRSCGAVLFLKYSRSSILRNPFPKKKDGNEY